MFRQVLQDGPLEALDEEVALMICREKARRQQSLEMSANEFSTSEAVMQAVGSCLMNTGSGGGSDALDRCYAICQSRAYSALRIPSDEWGVNIQVSLGGVGACVHATHKRRKK